METFDNEEVIDTVNLLFPNSAEKNPMINLKGVPIVDVAVANGLMHQLKRCSVDQVTFLNASEETRALFIRAHFHNHAKFYLQFV